jgi:hypothetical protein
MASLIETTGLVDRHSSFSVCRKRGHQLRRYNFLRACEIKAHHWHSKAQGFERDEAATIVKAGKEQEIVAVVELEQIILRQP